MKLKQLEGSLSRLRQFQSPKVDLEQYLTRPHIASRMLFMAENSFGDIDGKLVADLGCGCGTLGLAASLLGPIVDTVVMNPPFGTRRKGADMDFLSSALKIAETAVYSLHKTSTREHIKRAALRDVGAKTADVLCELRFDLPALYKFHKKREVDIFVDLWRFTSS
eukprot:c20431_g2_i4 orf=138-632(+)